MIQKDNNFESEIKKEIKNYETFKGNLYQSKSKPVENNSQVQLLNEFSYMDKLKKNEYLGKKHERNIFKEKKFNENYNKINIQNFCSGDSEWQKMIYSKY